jgi:hypothetical protein
MAHHRRTLKENWAALGNRTEVQNDRGMAISGETILRTTAHKASRSEATVEAAAFRPWNRGQKRSGFSRGPFARPQSNDRFLPCTAAAGRPRSSEGDAADCSQNGKPHPLQIPPPTRLPSRAIHPKRAILSSDVQPLSQMRRKRNGHLSPLQGERHRNHAGRDRN